MLYLAESLLRGRVRTNTTTSPLEKTTILEDWRVTYPSYNPRMDLYPYEPNSDKEPRTLAKFCRTIPEARIDLSLLLATNPDRLDSDR